MKIPAILGILILIIGIVAGVFLINSKQIFKLNAQIENIPKNVNVGNVTNNSITVTWTTDSESRGFVKWNKSKNNLSKVAVEEEVNQSNVHLVNIMNIDEDSDIFFTINSNGSDYKNNDIPWQSKTLKDSITPNSSLIAGGVILAQDGITPIRSIVNLTIDGAILSTTTSPEGSWIIPITTYIESVSNDTIIEININAGLKGVSQALIYPSAIKKTPVILLGKTYDFRTIEEDNDDNSPESKLSIPESIETSSRFEINKTDDTPTQTSVTVDSIKEGEIVTSTTPEFFGKGPENTAIEISVESELQSQSLTADKNGSWNWSPPENLEPGEHTITIKWVDISGITRTLTRNFTVSAAEGPAFESTPSASLSPSPSATPDVSATPTAKTSPKATATGSSQPTPETGSLTATLGLFIMGIGMLLGSVYIWNKSYAQSE